MSPTQHEPSLIKKSRPSTLDNEICLWYPILTLPYTHLHFQTYFTNIGLWGRNCPLLYVYTMPSIMGPWVRPPAPLQCRSSALPLPPPVSPTERQVSSTFCQREADTKGLNDLPKTTQSVAEMAL